MFGSLGGAQTWHLHTKLLLQIWWHTSGNNSQMKNTRDLTLEEAVFVSITCIYRIQDSWLYFSAPSSLFQKVAFWRPFIVKWSPQKKKSVAKKKENVKGKTLQDILHVAKKRRRFMTYYTKHRMAGFASKFTHSCGVSERREVKGEIRQVMPPLVLLIIFQVSFSFNLLFANLFANWRLSPEFWSPNIFSTRHGDQNGHSLECCIYCMVTIFSFDHMTSEKREL